MHIQDNVKDKAPTEQDLPNHSQGGGPTAGQKKEEKKTLKQLAKEKGLPWTVFDVSDKMLRVSQVQCNSATQNH